MAAEPTPQALKAADRLLELFAVQQGGPIVMHHPIMVGLSKSAKKDHRKIALRLHVQLMSGEDFEVFIGDLRRTVDRVDPDIAMRYGQDLLQYWDVPVADWPIATVREPIAGQAYWAGALIEALHELVARKPVLAWS